MFKKVMFKKLLITSAILAMSGNIALANGAPYVGAGLGITTNTGSNGSFRGVTGTVMGGYGAIMGESFYLGGELFGDAFTATMTDHGSGMRTTYGYGASILPGFMLSEHTMAFARLGVQLSHFSKADSTVMGGQAGLGFQTSMTQNWDVRGEYDYTDYRKVSGQNPVADQFDVSLIYKIQ